MNDETKAGDGAGRKASGLAGSLQLLQLAVTIMLAVLGFMLNKSSTEARDRLAVIEGDLKQKQEDRAAAEAADKLRIQLFEHVMAAIEKGQPNQRLAAKTLLTSFLKPEDELRTGLLIALATDAEPGVKQALQTVVEQDRRYLEQEAEVKTTAAQAPAVAPATGGGALARYYVDVFYCEVGGDAWRQRADAIVKLLATRTARSRLRVLPETLNQSPGMRVSSLQVRYNGNEADVARELSRLLATAQQGDFTPTAIRTATPNYLSVFVCA